MSFSPPSSSPQSPAPASCTPSDCLCTDYSPPRSRATKCSDRSTDCTQISSVFCSQKKLIYAHVPLNRCQDGSNIVGRTPAVLQDVQTQLASAVYVGVEHLRDELDAGRFVGVLFFEMHDEAECAVLERSVCGAYDNGIPIRSRSVSGAIDAEQIYACDAVVQRPCVWGQQHKHTRS